MLHVFFSFRTLPHMNTRRHRTRVGNLVSPAQFKLPVQSIEFLETGRMKQRSPVLLAVPDTHHTLCPLRGQSHYLTFCLCKFLPSILIPQLLTWLTVTEPCVKLTCAMRQNDGITTTREFDCVLNEAGSSGWNSSLSQLLLCVKVADRWHQNLEKESERKITDLIWYI